MMGPNRTNPDEPPIFDYKGWPTTSRSACKQDGRWLTQGLFYETINHAQHQRFCPLYTMQELEVWDPVYELWLPSAKQIYVQSDSEYEAAVKLLGSYEHWGRLLALKWFMEGPKNCASSGVSQWREEQEARKAHEITQKLLKAAQEGNVTAMKTLLGNKKPGREAGRPSKEEVEGKKKQMAQEDDDFKSDFARISVLHKD